MGPLGEGPTCESVFGKPATPIAPLASMTPSERKKAEKAAAPKPVSKKNEKRREYYKAHAVQYGVYELNRLKAMLAKEKDHEKCHKILERIEKREVAMGIASKPKPDNESN